VINKAGERAVRSDLEMCSFQSVMKPQSDLAWDMCGRRRPHRMHTQSVAYPTGSRDDYSTFTRECHAAKMV
jgi:hypothetical protein